MGLGRFLRFVACPVVLAAGVLTAMAAAGTAIPARHVVSRRAYYQQKPETVYSMLWAQPPWYPGFSGFEELPARGGKRKWNVRLRALVDLEVAFEEEEARAPEMLVINTADASLPFQGSWRYQVLPHKDGAILRITQIGAVRNPIHRCLAKFIVGYEAGLDDYLTRLGEKFGEIVHTTD